MELHLPELMSLNEYINLERKNKFMAAKAKKELTELVAWTVKSQLHGLTVERIEKITFIWQHKKRFAKDFDNVEFAQKFIRDGMVLSGLVKSDSWPFFPPRTLHKHEISIANGCTVVFW